MECISRGCDGRCEFHSDVGRWVQCGLEPLLRIVACCYQLCLRWGGISDGASSHSVSNAISHSTAGVSNTFSHSTAVRGQLGACHVDHWLLGLLQAKLLVAK